MIQEVQSRDPICPICKTRISNWMIVGGKTIVKDGVVYHKSCRIDYYWRHGREYEPQKEP